MRLLGRTSRDPTGSADQAVEQWLLEAGARLDPDPSFRRRLRSDVMNTWVAAREGIIQPARRRWVRSRMGSLGRGCLYVSVLFCASLAGVMAASSQSLPGEPMYAVKIRLEELRAEALPVEFRDELAVNALAERIQEMQRLSAAGAAAEAAALAPPIERHYTALLRVLEEPGSTTHSDFLGHRLGVVASLVETLPAELRGLVVGLMPSLPLAVPVVDADEPEPSPTSEPAAPARPAPAADPPTAPGAEPIGDPVTTSDETDPGRRDEEGSDEDDDDEGESDEDDDESDEDDDDESGADDD